MEPVFIFTPLCDEHFAILSVQAAIIEDMSLHQNRIDVPRNKRDISCKYSEYELFYLMHCHIGS